MKKIILAATGLLATFLTAQAQVFTPGNLAVVRLNGLDSTSSAGDAVIIDQYTTAGTLVNSTPVPVSGANALILNGEPYEGLMTAVPQGSSNLVLSGFNEALSSASGNLLSSTVPRCIGVMDAYGNFSLPVSVATAFSTFTPLGAASDGTNYWMAANGPSTTFPAATGGYPQVVYMGTAASPAFAQVATNTFSSTLRAVNVFYNSTAGAYNLYVSATSTNTPTANIYHGGTFTLSNLSGALPTTHTGASNYFADATATGGSTAAYDIAINPAGTIAYMADNDNGIVKYTYSGGVWTSNYTVQLTNATDITAGSPQFSGGATSVTADWTQSPPEVYATSGETATNRLVKFSDTNATGQVAVINLAQGNIISSGAGAITNSFRGVRFTPAAYGYISVPPVPFTGLPGTTATFSATVLGSPAPTLQWYSNSVANPTYVAITGATNATLSLSGITVAQSGSLFYLVASNIYGASSNTPVALTVLNPAITGEPVGATNFPSGPASTMCVTAEGNGTLAYQWFSNGVPISGATMSCYTVQSSSSSNSASYYVIVTNTAGASVTTATSTTTVVAYTPYLLYDLFDYANGNIVTDPGSQWTEESGSSLFLVTNDFLQVNQNIGGDSFIQGLFSQTVPDSSPTILWVSFIINVQQLPATPGGSYFAYFQDTNFDFYGRLVCVTTNALNFTPDISPVAYPGTYRIGIANYKAEIPSAVTELDMAPGIDYQVVAYYDPGNLVCQVSVNPSPANYAQAYSPGGNPSSLVSGPTGDAFTPTNMPMAAYGFREQTDEGVINITDLQVSYDWNGAGSGFAAVTAGTVTNKAVVGLLTPGITNYTGNSNIMEVAASGIGISYQWCQNGTNLADGYSITGSATPTLTINPEYATNTGSYTVVISNAAGAVTSSVAPVYINPTNTAPFFTVQPLSLTTSLGSTVTFTATAVGSGPITYVWNQNGSPVGTGSSLTLTGVSTNMNGYSYDVVATGTASPPATSSNAILTVNGPIVTNIAFLRSLLITSSAPTITIAASNSVPVYQITGYVIVSTNIETATYNEYWIQDTTGGVEVFIDPGNTGFTPKFGDLITVSGIVDIFDDAEEMDNNGSVQEPYSIVSTNGETGPLPFTPELIPFGFATANPGLSALSYQGKLATFTNCYFEGYGFTVVNNVTNANTFANGTTYVVTNTTGQTYSLYIGQGAGPDLAGTPIPQFAYSVTGAFDQFSSTFELNLSAGTNIISAPPPPATPTATSSGNSVTLSWTAVPSRYTYSVWSTTNLTVPFTPLAPGLFFSSTNGTYTATPPTNSPAVFYEIVSP